MIKRLLVMMLALGLMCLAVPGLAEDEDVYFGPFSAEDLNGGETVTEAVFEDASITLINYWTTWCGYCIDELPYLESLSGLTDGKVQVISVLMDGREADGSRVESAIEAMETLLAEAGVQYPSLLPDELLWSIGSVVQGYPTTFVVDNTGKLITGVTGSRTADEWLEIAQDAADEAYAGEVKLAAE